MLPKIISFSGRKRSGKTELAKICMKYNYELINFADGLKDLICNSLEITREYLEEHKDKINENTYDLSKKITYISKEINIDEEIIKPFLLEPFNSIRAILQIIGTNLIRNYNPLWHIDKVKEKIINNPEKYYCIGDTRFLNEKKTVEELNGECWFIIRPNMFDISNHNSEIELKWTEFGDNIIINNLNKHDLIFKWENYLKNNVKYVNDDINNNINKRAFLEITKETSYIMGILTSKGYLKQDTYNTTLYLKNIDKSIIEIYQRILKLNNDCMDCDNPFIIENIKLWDLEPNKNKKIPFLLRDNVEMLKYWIVGLIDGDGIILSSNKNISLSILSSKEIIEYIQDILRFGTIIKHDNLYKITFVNNNCIEFYNWLGDASSFGIKRKWNNIHKFISSLTS